MIKAYFLYTGDDGNSHFKIGSIKEGAEVKAQYTQFKETAAHSSLDFHKDPVPRYVITLSGILEFTTKTGESFTLHPGEVLLATDNTGTGHKWRLVNDEPWKRVYVVFEENADTYFIPHTE
jgi:quercetin dioxygenase-like cupin family protein